MHGYGVYVYSAYAIVLSSLGIFLFNAIKRGNYIKAMIINNKVKR